MQIGNGWTVVHLTERTLELRKESHEYRRLTGRDGFVLVRGEPGIPKHVLIEQATEQAMALDAELARRIARELLPTPQALGIYGGKVKQYVPVMSTGEEEFYLGKETAMKQYDENDVEIFKDALTALLSAWNTRFTTEDGDQRVSESFNLVVGMYRQAIDVPHPMEEEALTRGRRS